MEKIPEETQPKSENKELYYMDSSYYHENKDAFKTKKGKEK